MSEDQAASQKPVCFVIGPIGEQGSEVRKHADAVLEHVIGPVLSELGYAPPLRADRMGQPGLITHQIIEQLCEAPLVVADLSFGNPNVYYELAARHALQRPVVCLALTTSPRPFDVADVRIVPLYLSVPELADITKPQLKEQIEAVQACAPGSGILRSPLSAAVDLIQLGKSQGSSDQRLASLLHAIQNLGIAVTEADARTRTEVAALRQVIFSSSSVKDTLSPDYPWKVLAASVPVPPSLSGLTDVSHGSTIPPGTIRTTP